MPLSRRLTRDRSPSSSSVGMLARTMSSDSTASYSARVTPHIADVIFDLYRNVESETLSVHSLLKSLNECGIRDDDPRLRSFIKAVADEERRQSVSDLTPSDSATNLDRDTFRRCVSESIGTISKALKKQLVIPDWPMFVSVITDIFESCRNFKDGKVADYIPQLARCDPSNWAVSICTVDGQRRSWGDSKVPFCLQSVSKPFTYTIALEELGADEVHRYVGQEPSGRLFNEICLDHNHKPHNPMINAGAILVASLLKRNYSLSDRFDFALHQLKKFACEGFVGFNNAVFLSERETADRNYALSYYMREHKCFPANTNIQILKASTFRHIMPILHHLTALSCVGDLTSEFYLEGARKCDALVRTWKAVRKRARETVTMYGSYNSLDESIYCTALKRIDALYADDTLDLYFQLCSIETNADTLAVMAATLANGGVSPLSEQRVVCNRAVRDTLSLMYSCGMYDYSGQFAFTVGLPAKSGVSGDMIIVVPNVMGICIYSPPLDSLGNTVRGVKFAEQLVEKFNFHNYDSLVYSETHKIDPRKTVREARHESISNMMYAARAGDISAIQRYILLGVSIHDRDYDERTVLHIAAAEGNDYVLKFLLERWKESPDPVDRYGRTPLDDAKEFGRVKCVELLEKALSREGILISSPLGQTKNSIADTNTASLNAPIPNPETRSLPADHDNMSLDTTTALPTSTDPPTRIANSSLENRSWLPANRKDASSAESSLPLSD